MTESVAKDRQDYGSEGLSEGQLAPTPYAQAALWVQEATARWRDAPSAFEPLTLALATVDGAGAPNVRTVLMRFFDERGPGFVTSLDAAKSRELAAHPVAAAELSLPGVPRTVRFRGPVERIGHEVDAYWGERPWGSRIAAWASEQSSPIASRAALEAVFDRYAAQWPDRGGPDDVPIPPSWCGWRILPDEVEFWAGRSSRLHDRLVYVRTGPGGLADAEAWRVERRQP